MLLTLKSSLFPPKAPTQPLWVAEGTPLLCLGVVAMPGDRISHPQVAGLHHHGEDQSLDLPAAARLWVFCKRLKAVWHDPAQSPSYIFFSFSTCCPCCSSHTWPWCGAASGSPCLPPAFLWVSRPLESREKSQLCPTKVSIGFNPHRKGLSAGVIKRGGWIQHALW